MTVGFAMTELPRILITMGDAAGIGPEIIAKAWGRFQSVCLPVVVGDPDRMRWACNVAGASIAVSAIPSIDTAHSSADEMVCIRASSQNVADVLPGKVSRACGLAAYEYLCAAIDSTLAGQAAGIVTAPIHKEGLREAGLRYPGHTEILAERTKASRYAMVLYGDGLAVIHVTLHMALRDVFSYLTAEAVLEKIRLLQNLLRRLHRRSPRLAVAALNPHASDGGLFGDEEAKIIEPAVREAQREDVNVTGPWPCDTLFARAARGEFDGIVAMYHDQGHIPLKLRSGMRAVNITAGLPIVRTSVAHGTAYDIAGKGAADPSSLVEAVRVAARLAAST
jgi:4-hydroxythreonine-4-phosphate dehydrogenase